jgi:formylglycine-generating enzyme required for sulfatase activity
MRWATSLLLAASLSLAPQAVLAASFELVSVGSLGNAPDDTGYGSVDHAYRIGKLEVTNGQYTELLNSVGATDPNGLYSTSMGPSGWGGITRSGVEGSYTYATDAYWADRPVNYVSYYDSLRFVNWLENGQPVGSQDATTTEDGSYTFTGVTSAGGRNAHARHYLPSEDEWYKAAYFDPVAALYREYPTGSDFFPDCEEPVGGSNSANCGFAVGTLTRAGAYAATSSPFGTLDQGGNVFEWNEARLGGDRGMRGGSWLDPASSDYLAASHRGSGNPAVGTVSMGFRIAAIPEPGSGLLLCFGLALLGYARSQT